MRISTKCSLALHLLVLLEVFAGQKLTSEVLAQSTGCNPAVVRNLLGSLKRAGMVTVARGTGGAALTKAPGDITLWAVMHAVDPQALHEPIGLHPNPSEACPVGKNITALLEEPYGLVAHSVRTALQGYTLEQLVAAYRVKAGNTGKTP